MQTRNHSVSGKREYSSSCEKLHEARQSRGSRYLRLPGRRARQPRRRLEQGVDAAAHAPVADRDEQPAAEDPERQPQVARTPGDGRGGQPAKHDQGVALEPPDERVGRRPAHGVFEPPPSRLASSAATTRITRTTFSTPAAMPTAKPSSSSHG